MKQWLLFVALACLLALSRASLLHPSAEAEEAGLVADLDPSDGPQPIALIDLEQEESAQASGAEAEASEEQLAMLEAWQRSRTSSPYAHELRERLQAEAQAEAQAKAAASAAAAAEEATLADELDVSLLSRVEGEESAAEIRRRLDPLLHPSPSRALGHETPEAPTMSLPFMREQRRLRSEHMKRVLEAKMKRAQARAHAHAQAHEDAEQEQEAEEDASEAKAALQARLGQLSSVSNHSVVKSREDDRLYRFITLPNGLRAVLVSDPNTTKSAAAMDVGNGYLSDPAEIPGLHHFLEHMLFLGTEKYPSESAYADFIEAHGGFSNAYTGMENTNYYYDVLPSHLEGALDRFAQFFIAPLFNVNSTGREMKAVDSEHSKNLLSDNWRTNRLLQALANQSHPYSKFGTGCAQTLDVMPHAQMRQHLREAWRKHYTAGNMYLTVLGQETLDQLQAMVERMFAAVPRTERLFDPLARTSERDVFNSSMLGSEVFVNTIEDTKFLSLVFPAPSQFPTYRSQALAFLRTLVEGRGTHSLTKQLKNRGWATAVQLGVDAATSAFSTLQFSVDLTDAGSAHVDEIIAAFFAQLREIREKGVQEWRFEEMRRIANLTFTYKDKEQPSRYISKLASNLRRYPPEDVLIGGRLFLEFNPTHIRRLVDCMRPDNMLLLLGGKRLNHSMRYRERWYGIEYDVQPLDSKRIKMWKDAPRVARRAKWVFRLPKPSKFIPSTLRVNPPLSRPVPVPIILSESPSNATSAARLWFSEDLEFHRPQAHAVFRLYAPQLYASARAYLLTHIYVSLLEDQVDEQLYSALLAGFSATFRVGGVHLDLVLHGFNVGLVEYAQSVARIMNPSKGFKPDRQRFDVYKESLLNSYLNKKYEAPHRQSTQLLSALLDPRHVSAFDLVRTLQSLSFEDVSSWPRTLFGDMSLEAYVHGNVHPNDARQMMSIFMRHCPFVTTSTAFARNPARNHYVPRPRLGQLREDVSVSMFAPNAAESNSAVVRYWQYGVGGIESKLYAQLLGLMSQKPIFHQLRTTEQLGYIVWSSPDQRLDVSGFKIQVQSGRRSAHHVAQRIDAFVPQLQRRLANLTQSAFEGYIETLMMSKLQSPVSMGVQAAWFWSEIARQEYVFQRKEIELYLLNATKIINRPGFEQFMTRLFYISDVNNPPVESCELRGGGAISVRIEAPAKPKPAPSNGTVPLQSQSSQPQPAKAKKPQPDSAEVVLQKTLELLAAEEQLDHVAELQDVAQAQRDEQEAQKDQMEAQADNKIVGGAAFLELSVEADVDTEAEVETEAEVDADAEADADADVDAEDEDDHSHTYAELGSAHAPHASVSASAEEEEQLLSLESANADDESDHVLHAQAQAPKKKQNKAAHKGKGKRGGASGPFRVGSDKSVSLESLDQPVSILSRGRDGSVSLLNTTQSNLRQFSDSLMLYPRAPHASPPPVAQWVDETPDEDEVFEAERSATLRGLATVAGVHALAVQKPAAAVAAIKAAAKPSAAPAPKPAAVSAARKAKPSGMRGKMAAAKQAAKRAAKAVPRHARKVAVSAGQRVRSAAKSVAKSVGKKKKNSKKQGKQSQAKAAAGKQNKPRAQEE